MAKSIVLFVPGQPAGWSFPSSIAMIMRWPFEQAEVFLRGGQSSSLLLQSHAASHPGAAGKCRRCLGGLFAGRAGAFFWGRRGVSFSGGSPGDNVDDGGEDSKDADVTSVLNQLGI